MLVSFYTCESNHVSHLCRVRSSNMILLPGFNLMSFDHISFALVMRA